LLRDNLQLSRPALVPIHPPIQWVPRHTVRKLSHLLLTADWLAPRDSDCSRMHSTISSGWLPSYIKATRPVVEIFRMAGYFPDSPRMYCQLLVIFYTATPQRTEAAKKCIAFLHFFISFKA